MKPDPPALIFKSNDGFFDYWCKWGDNRIVLDRAYVAQLLDARAVFGTSEAVKVDETGQQTAALRVVSNDGGFNVLALTLSPNGPRLRPGDLVFWVPGQHSPEFGKAFGDDRSGYVGLISAVIDRVWSVSDGFRILGSFEPIG